MKKLLKVILVVVICYCIALVTNLIFLEQIVISGDSMDENLKNGEFGFADKQVYKLSGVKRFDIVIVENSGQKIIKRIIGLPNETITYKDGILLVNGKVVEEDFISDEEKLNTNRDDLEISLTLGDNEYYVLGDNRLISYDSRNIGPVNKEQIKGRLFMIYGYCLDPLFTCDSNDKCDCERRYFWPRFY